MKSGFEILGAILCIIFIVCVAEASDTSSRQSIKTIETDDGAVYDCVDFYKQPAFDHPLLKNHSYHPEMRPSSWPENIGDTPRSSTAKEATIEFLKGGGCPRGTVPIRRLSEDDKLLRNELHRKYYPQLGEVDPNEKYNYFTAITQSMRSIPRAYYGMAANLSIWNPKVQPSQYSSTQIIIRGLTDAIYAGWTVNPGRYKDNQTRFFIYAHAKTLHCFNAECGFISVRPDISLDFVIKPVSEPLGPVYLLEFTVFMDKKSGNWWVAVKNMLLGFWDQSYFDGLQKVGDYVACGGAVAGPSDLKNPEMGSGYKPFFRLRNVNAFCKDFRVVDENNKFVYQDDVLETYSSSPDYGVSKFTKFDNHMYIYGGPNVME